MPVASVGFTVQVPGNAARCFPTAEEARAQPLGMLDMAWDSADPYIFNRAYDARLIRHDDSYCTSVVNIDQVVQLPTTSYFDQRVAPHLPAAGRIIDIGCGQGEFVEHLASAGFAVAGYDPVLREPAAHLHRRYWTSDEPPAELYIMRCVLPHISMPWAFIADVADSSPGSLVLIEFQRIEWVLQHSLWYQLNHEHVNQFTLDDFAARYDVVDSGTFSQGEWAWVLIRADRISEPPVSPIGSCEVQLGALAQVRSAALETLSKADRHLAIWGAAGKGIVLAHDLSVSRGDITAIDADPIRWNRFLEGSGVLVTSPAAAMETLPDDTLVLVSNPNHLPDIRKRVGGRWAVSLPTDFAGSPGSGASADRRGSG